MKKLKGIDGKLDDAWALAVKIKAGMKCEYCGNTNALNAHHVYSRSNRSTRWDLSNGYSLCVAHHVFGTFSAHKSPMDFGEWMVKDRGQTWLDRLRLKAHSLGKFSKGEKEQMLNELLNFINSKTKDNKI